jgi:hypothetical protein
MSYRMERAVKRGKEGIGQGKWQEVGLPGERENPNRITGT